MLLLPKRLEVYQEAYNLAQELRHKIYEDEEKIEAVKEAQEWYSNNCLYLKPDLRVKYSAFIHNVLMHKDLVENWRAVGQENGNFESPEAIKCKQEIRDNMEDIKNMQIQIQEDIDQYYQNIQD